MMRMPALAVVGPDRRIVRSTETFRQRCEDAEQVSRSSVELQQVLAGQADVATLVLGELSVAIEAVTDATGRRQALLTLPRLDSSPASESPLDALRDAADESPAIVWVKALDGRQLYANPRYKEELGTPEERDVTDGPKEPLQLEYTVPATDRLPALAVFRFALRDDRGRPIAACGVAAPTTDAETARAAAVHLMQLERWNRLDPAEVRAELLEQWRLQAAAPAESAPESAEEAEELRRQLVEARARAEEAEADAEEAKAATARAAEEAARWRSEAEQARRELAAARAAAETLRPSVAAVSLSEGLPAKAQSFMRSH